MNWKPPIRASEAFDIDNPRDWSNFFGTAEMDELRPTMIQGYWDDLENEVFMGTDDNEYVYASGQPVIAGGELTTATQFGDIEYSKELIIYSSARTEVQLLKIGKYYKNLVGI